MLFNGNRPGESTGQHLNRIFGTSGRFEGPEYFVWTTRTQGQLVQYNGGGGGQAVNVTSQSGIFINLPSAVTFEARPLFPHNRFNDRARTEAMINEMFNDTRGGIIVMGNTGQNNLM